MENIRIERTVLNFHSKYANKTFNVFKMAFHNPALVASTRYSKTTFSLECLLAQKKARWVPKASRWRRNSKCKLVHSFLLSNEIKFPHFEWNGFLKVAFITEKTGRYESGWISDFKKSSQCEFSVVCFYGGAFRI